MATMGVKRLMASQFYLTAVRVLSWTVKPVESVLHCSEAIITGLIHWSNSHRPTTRSFAQTIARRSPSVYRRKSSNSTGTESNLRLLTLFGALDCEMAAAVMRVTWRFALKTFRPWMYSTFPAYTVKTQAPSFGYFYYSCHSVHMSCRIKNLLTYLPGAEISWGLNIQGTS